MARNGMKGAVELGLRVRVARTKATARVGLRAARRASKWMATISPANLLTANISPNSIFIELVL